MSSIDKLEGQIVLGSSVSIKVTEDAGARNKTLVVAAAGTYFPNTSTALLAAIAAALTADVTLLGNYTVTSDDDTDTATGKVTVAVSGGASAFAIDWLGVTTLMSILGFTGNTSNAASAQGANAMRYLWLPNVARNGIKYDVLTDGTVTMSPSGKMKSLSFATRYADALEYANLKGRKAKIAYETVVNESLEKFFTDVIGKGTPFRLHPDRSVDGTYTQYRAMKVHQLGLVPHDPAWEQAAALYKYSTPIAQDV